MSEHQMDAADHTVESRVEKDLFSQQVEKLASEIF